MRRWSWKVVFTRERAGSARGWRLAAQRSKRSLWELLHKVRNINYRCVIAINE